MMGGACPDLSGMNREDKLAALRAQLVSIHGGQASRTASSEEEKRQDTSDYVELPEVFSSVVRGGGLPRRAVTLASDCPALLVSLAAYVSARGERIAFVGWDDVLLAELVEEGGELENIIVIRGAAEHCIQIAAVLVEGMDVVIAYLPEVRQLGMAAERALRAKLRRGDCAVVLVGHSRMVASADLRLGAIPRRFHGMDMTGRGRITGIDIDVAVQQRGMPASTVRYTLRTSRGVVEPRGARGQRVESLGAERGERSAYGSPDERNAVGAESVQLRAV